MKNAFLKSAFICLILTLNVFAQANDDGVCKPSNEHPQEHRGFYNSSSFGFSYLRADKKKSDSYSEDEYAVREFKTHEASGFTFPVMEFKFGAAVANIVAFHTVFNLALYGGTTDYAYKEDRRNYAVRQKDSTQYSVYYYYYNPDYGEVRYDGDWYSHQTKSDSYNALIFRSFVGFGTTIYPFEYLDSPMNGFYLGGSIGYALTGVVAKGGGWVGYGRAFQLDIGKDWWINDHFSLGVGFTYGHSFLKDVGSEGSDDTFTLSLRLVRG